MPTYEYRCGACARDFEVVQKITEEPLKECPRCGAAVERLIAGGNFILKGSGWYKSDYAPSQPSSRDDAPSPPCSAKKDKSSCQTCPAATPDR